MSITYIYGHSVIIHLIVHNFYGIMAKHSIFKVVKLLSTLTLI